MEQQYRRFCLILFKKIKIFSQRNCRKCGVPIFYQHPFNLQITFIFESALLSANEIGGITGNNEEEKVQKVMLKKHVRNQGFVFFK